MRRRAACWRRSAWIIDRMAAGAKRRQAGWRYRGNVALRTLAGTAGAYLVAALAAAMLARTLPMSREILHIDKQQHTFIWVYRYISCEVHIISFINLLRAVPSNFDQKFTPRSSEI